MNRISIEQNGDARKMLGNLPPEERDGIWKHAVDRTTHRWSHLSSIIPAVGAFSFGAVFMSFASNTLLWLIISLAAMGSVGWQAGIWVYKVMLARRAVSNLKTIVRDANVPPNASV